MINKQIQNLLLGVAVLLLFVSCNTTEPEPVKLNVDNCEHCKMTIADLKFAAELITDKGRIYKFDDLSCLLSYKKDQSLVNTKEFVADYNNPKDFVNAEEAFFVSGEKVQSPMNGNVAGFAKKEDAEKFASEKGATVTGWGQVNQ